MTEAELKAVGATGCATAWVHALRAAAPGADRDVLPVLLAGYRESLVEDTVGVAYDEPELPLDDVGKLLNERGKTHGSWRTQSMVTHEIKLAFRLSPNWLALPPSTVEALDMVAGKIGRILCGNPNEVDHYDDIIGYVRLARDGGHR